MDSSWQSQPIHVVDFEGNTSYGVIEYGVATLQDGKIKACHTRLCAAEDEVSERDAWVHGLRRSDTVGFPAFKEDFALFNALRSEGPLAAHHATYEHALLKRVWPYPTAAPNFAQPGREVAYWGPWIDTRVLYTRLYPDLSSHKLGELVAVLALQERLDALAQTHCPEKRQKYHCALYDALAAALLLQCLAETGDLGDISLAQLVALSHGQEPESQGELF